MAHSASRFRSADHTIFKFVTFTAVAVLAGIAAPDCVHAQRAGDRFGVRIGMWPQKDIEGTFARISLRGDTLIYDAVIEEDGRLLPFLELYGLFNLKGSVWAEVSAGFSQRTDVEATGIRVNPPPEDTLPRILLGEGRVDFLPLFLGVRVVREQTTDRPHNLYARGGVSLLIAAEQPTAVNPEIQQGIYVEGTKASFGTLLAVGGEYYLSHRFGLVGDVAYRLNKLNYGDDANFNLSTIWVSLGATLRVR